MKSFKKLFVICLTILAAATFSGVMLSCSDDSSDSSAVVYYYPESLDSEAITLAPAAGGFTGLDNCYSVYSVKVGDDAPIVMANLGAYMVFYFDAVTVPANPKVYGIVRFGTPEWIYCLTPTAAGEVPSVFQGASWDEGTTALSAIVAAGPPPVVAAIGTFAPTGTGTAASISGDDVIFTTVSAADGTTPVIYTLDTISDDYFTQSGAATEDCPGVSSILAAMGK